MSAGDEVRRTMANGTVHDLALVVAARLDEAEERETLAAARIGALEAKVAALDRRTIGSTVLGDLG